MFPPLNPKFEIIFFNTRFYWSVSYSWLTVQLSCRLQSDGPAVKDMLEAGILDPYLVKYWGIKLATNSAITVLRVDQVGTNKTFLTHKLYM